MPNATRPGAASASDATDWARHGRGPGVGGNDGAAEAQLGCPGSRECQWGECVCTVGLRRPHVGVAQVDQLAEPLAVLRQRDTVEGDGHAVAPLRARR